MTSVSLLAGSLSWRFQTWGRPENPAIVFLHGFTWDGASWEAVARPLSEHYYCVAPDLPGHGATDSPEPIAEWSFDRVVDALAEALHGLGISKAHLVGYSMGGRIALRLAVLQALGLESLVLVGASAGLATVQDRMSRMRADAELAERLVDEGMEAFLERWMAQPLFDTMRALEPTLLATLNAGRSQQDPRGLAASLRTMGTGSQPYLMEALADLSVPTLLVVGELDAKFRRLAEAMRLSLPQGRLEIVRDCGHSVPFERPRELSALVTPFFTEARLAPSSC